jgi:hypothetical protein
MGSQMTASPASFLYLSSGAIFLRFGELRWRSLFEIVRNMV